MNAFWWFREGEIAGMARPGFNSTPWFELPFIEAQLLGWLGQHSSGELPLASFRSHLKTYVPRIMKFYGLSEAEGARQLATFESADGFVRVLKSLSDRTGMISSFEISEDSLHLELCPSRLHEELSALRNRGITRVVSLTEKHHSQNELAEHFEVHHISIEDLSAPSVEQAHELAEILCEARSEGDVVAVHCLAGIGRTSTMLMGAHLIMGDTLPDLETLIKRQNPSFSLTGSQAEFLRSLAREPLTAFPYARQ